MSISGVTDSGGDSRRLGVVQGQQVANNQLVTIEDLTNALLRGSDFERAQAAYTLADFKGSAEELNLEELDLVVEALLTASTTASITSTKTNKTAVFEDIIFALGNLGKDVEGPLRQKALFRLNELFLEHAAQSAKLTKAMSINPTGKSYRNIHPNVQCHIVYVMRLFGKEAVPFLETAAKDPDDFVRLQTITVLTDMKTEMNVEEAVPVLEKALTDLSVDVCLEARRGLGLPYRIKRLFSS